MSYIAESISKDKVGGNIVVKVRLTDTDTGKTEDLDVPADDLTNDSLAAFMQRIVESREKRDALFETIVIGPIVLPRDASDQATKDKIAAAAAADAFFVLLADYNALQAQVDKKIIAPDDKAVSEAANAMKTAFLPEYASDPRFH